MTFWIVYLFFIIQRLYEMRVGKVNLQKLLPHLVTPINLVEKKRMLWLHAGWFFSLGAEYFFWGDLPSSLLSGVFLSFLLLLQLLRWWIIKQLGIYWVPYPVAFHGQKLVESGLYRYFKHPNYLIVILEFIILPLWAGCYGTLLVGSFFNIVFLKERISLEESAISRRLM